MVASCFHTAAELHVVMGTGTSCDTSPCVCVCVCVRARVCVCSEWCSSPLGRSDQEVEHHSDGLTLLRET